VKKPIRVFWSDLGQRFYASDRYKEEGGLITITGEKFDVTDQIAEAVLKHEIEFKVKKP
jgi:hypothetical protein